MAPYPGRTRGLRPRGPGQRGGEPVARWRSRRVRESPLEDHAHPVVGGPEQGVLDRDEVVRALGTLPVRMRAVLVLRFFDDLTEAQTAAALGCGVGTVKSQTSRGLARMRALLADADNVTNGSR